MTVMKPFIERLLTPLLMAALLMAGTFVPAQALQQVPADTTPRAAAGAQSAIVQGSVGRSSMDLEATYDVVADLEWGARTIDARTTLTVRNTSGSSIDRLELNSLAGALGNMRIRASRVDGQAVDVDVVDQTILVPLGGILPAGESVEVFIRYSATFRSTATGRNYFFTRSGGILSVHRWIPWISRKTPFWSAERGDPFTTPVSPEVRVVLTADRALKYATTGAPTGKQGNRQSFVARNVRDFNFTAAPDFGKLTGRSMDGDTKIVVYSRTLPRAMMLDYARRSMAAFEDKIGQYPYSRFTVTESSGGIAMESPGHIWIPRGTPDWNVPFLVVHEMGHQWFYGVVGNDQVREPFADEAMTEFLTRWFLGQFRASRCDKDRLDRSIGGYNASCFYEVVYVQGASFINRLRQDVGDGRFWSAVRDYWNDNQFEFGGTVSLLEALRVAADQADVQVYSRYSSRFPRYY
ncbi:MAG: hypothetical protein M3452_04225 [Chloroflexota bacterium]|nr:hypothetical protein [Chloroflexota bacterium]